MYKNKAMANKGLMLEEEVKRSNIAYAIKGMALVQKISTPWKVIRKGKQIVSAFPEEKSTLDFRGTIRGGAAISFDCKESENPKGLPLKYIKPHQIAYMKEAIAIGEITFIVCLIKSENKRYLISGEKILRYWAHWQANKGKRDTNYIPIKDMREIKSQNGIVLDYLNGLDGLEE